MQLHPIGITSVPERQPEALQIAMNLGLKFIPEESNETAQYEYLLILMPDYIGIYKPAEKQRKPFYINFLAPKLLYRTEKAGLRNELIARAMGKSPKENPIIVDATAGWGRDSFILASIGFNVTMLECSSIVSLLLADALARAINEPETETIVTHLQLIQTDAIPFLKALKPDNYPDIIYLDPMFPERKKSALVKKEMVILQDLLSKDSNNDELFHTAIACAKQRVVVKRPRLAENIVQLAPNFSLSGKTNRFDIYLV